jgi:hypothetical protein
LREPVFEGFCNEPDCFMASPYTVDEDHWTDGFVTMPVAEG